MSRNISTAACIAATALALACADEDAERGVPDAMDAFDAERATPGELEIAGIIARGEIVSLAVESAERAREGAPMADLDAIIVEREDGAEVVWFNDFGSEDAGIVMSGAVRTIDRMTDDAPAAIEISMYAELGDRTLYLEGDASCQVRPGLLPNCTMDNDFLATLDMPGRPSALDMSPVASGGISYAPAEAQPAIMCLPGEREAMIKLFRCDDDAPGQ